jgi:hypothetical protein
MRDEAAKRANCLRFAATRLKFAARLKQGAAGSRPSTSSPSTDVDFLGYPIRTS